MSAASSTPTAPPTAPAGAHPAPTLARLNEVLRHERAPLDLHEARAAMLEVARRKSGRLPAEWLVEQALRVTEGTDWVTRRAALDALLRRLNFAVRDELGIDERPAGGALLGRYALAGRARKDVGRRAGAQRRPYDVDVYALTPLAASCNCADFLRSSLGLCKHLLVVLEDIALRERKAKAMAQELAVSAIPRPALSWNPVRAWTGSGDRLQGLRWRTNSAPVAAAHDAPVSSALASGEPSPSVLASPETRAALVRELLDLFDTSRASAEPAALLVLREERERIEREVRGRAATAEALPHLETLRRQLYPYQHEGVLRFLERKRLLLADDMGLGKTTQAIAACHALYESQQVQRGLLIVPAALKDQWVREWQATTDRAPIAAVEGRADERARQLEQTERGFLVMNYEQLLRDLPAVQRFAPSLVVLDEAQRIKNWASKSSAHVMSLEPEWRLVLTGTPLENRLEELATLLDWVDDTALAPKWRLGPWHTAWDSARMNERLGARHLDTLRERLAPCLLRRVRREVLRQLPARSDVRVPVEMTAPQREEHDARIVPIARLLQIGRRRPLRQPEFLELMQLLAQQRIISNGLALLRFDSVWPVYGNARADDALLVSASSPKLIELRRIIQELVIEQNRKVVVFSQWRRMLRLAEWSVRDVLAEAGVSSVFFTGEESQQKRSQNVAAFHEEPGVRVMFLSDAGGVGLNLQRAANACINLELPWNPAVLEQRIGRIYRLGQADPVDVIHLVTEYGIESRIAGLVEHKQALFSGLFDGTTDTVRFDGPSSFTGDIERLIEPIEVPEASGAEDATDANDDAEEPRESQAVGGAGAAGELETLPDRPDPVQARANEPGAGPDLASVCVAPSGASAGPPSSLGAAQLLQQLTICRTPDGGLRIEAPPSVAAELSQLLGGLVELLKAASDGSTRSE